MTRAGFCTECGDNVFLNDEGACPEGHGPDCIRDEYEVAGDEAVTDVADDSVPETADEPVSENATEAAVSPSDAPSSSAPSTSSLDVAPTRSRTGLGVFAVAAVLLLVALIAAALVMLPALRKSADAPAAATAGTGKARVEASIAFLNALFSDDTMKIKPLLTDEAQNAITAEQWNEIASAFPTATVEFDEPTWSSDTTAVVNVTTEEATATLTVGASLSATTTVNVVLDVAGTTERATLSLRLAGNGWRIVMIEDETGGATLYDDAFVRSLHEEAVAD